jgi:hypothetical protein
VRTRSEIRADGPADLAVRRAACRWRSLAGAGYGLLANRHPREKLALCRELLGAAAAGELEKVEPMARPEGSRPVEPTRSCPVCGAGWLVVIAELPAMVRVEGGEAAAGRGLSHETS